MLAQTYLGAAATYGGTVTASLPSNQRFSFACIVDLPTVIRRVTGPSISVDKSMELGRKAASGTANSMISRSLLLPLASCWWTGIRWYRPSLTRC